MKVLLDTHIVLWALADSEKLPAKAREIINNNENEIFYSLVSAWEVAIKHNLHPDKIPISEEDFLENIFFMTHDSLIPYYEEPCVLSV